MAISMLVVDDNEDVRQMVELALRGLPVDIVGLAVDGVQAIDMARELKPDVILMDVVMPNMNGVEATRIIHNEMPEITIIGFTGSDPGAVDDMLNAGAVAVFLKTSFAEVIEKVQSLELDDPGRENS